MAYMGSDMSVAWFSSTSSSPLHCADGLVIKLAQQVRNQPKIKLKSADFLQILFHCGLELFNGPKNKTQVDLKIAAEDFKNFFPNQQLPQNLKLPETLTQRKTLFGASAENFERPIFLSS